MAALKLYQYQEENELPFEYDRNYIFTTGGLYEMMAGQYLSATVEYEAIFDTMRMWQYNFVGDYDDLHLRVAYDGGTLVYRDGVGDADGPFMVKLTTCVYNPSGSATDLGVAVWDTIMGDVYFVPQGGSNFGDVTYTFSNLDGVPLGNYTYTKDSNYMTDCVPLSDIIGPQTEQFIPLRLTKSTSTPSTWVFGDVVPALTGTNDATLYPTILVAEYPDGKLISYNIGQKETWQPTQTFNQGLNDGDGYWLILKDSGTVHKEIPLSDDIIAMRTTLDAIKTLSTIAHNYAQTYYNYLVVNGDDGIPYVPPSVIPIDPDVMANMTMAELYAIYIAYMMALEEGFENGYTVGPGNVTVSLDSLRLVCRGSIYNSTGSQVASDQTLFTPFVTINDMILTLGNNTMNQPGFAIKWGEASDLSEEYGDPSNESFQPQTMRYISLGVNYTLDIEEMYFMGQAADTVWLNVTDLTVYSPDLSPPPAGPDMQNDMEWLTAHWYYFAIVAGVICLLAAISFRNMAIITVGLILIGAGAIGWWMAGDTSLLSWFSMEPTNLRAWLQQLR